MGKHRKSIIREAIERFDSKMAIGESRREAKEDLQRTGQKTWAFSTGKIHSHKTRTTYQEHVLKLCNFARGEGVRSLSDLDARADELASKYLQLQVDQARSPWTLATVRSSFRMFFGDRTLCSGISLPHRTRDAIKRSRGSSTSDQHFNPEKHVALVNFLRATGLRRSEVRHLRVGDISSSDGRVLVTVRSGKGGKFREVPVLPGRAADVLDLAKGRALGDRVFASIPKHIDVHSFRREYARALYLSLSRGPGLPLVVNGRVRARSYDRAAALAVSKALGHNRLDVVLKHYLC